MLVYHDKTLAGFTEFIAVYIYQELSFLEQNVSIRDDKFSEQSGGLSTILQFSR